MKKIVLLLIVFTAFAFAAQSQNATDTVKTKSEVKKCCFRISNLSIASGVNKYRVQSRFDDMYEDNGRNKEAHFGKMGFRMENDNRNIRSRNYINLEMGLNPWSKKMGIYNRRQELTIGLYYSASNLEDSYYSSFATTPGDTFTFNTIKYKTDTLSRTEHYFARGADLLGARVEYLFKTDPEKRFSVFTGVGIDLSYTLRTEISESIVKDSSIVLNFYNNSSTMDFMNTQTNLGSEDIMHYFGKGDPTFFTGVYIPYGLNFRLCKKKEILNQFSLFMKGSLGLEAEFASNHKPRFNPFMGTSLGLKFNFK
jgi:hypothetical protein